jgi:hypothetical protein
MRNFTVAWRARRHVQCRAVLRNLEVAVAFLVERSHLPELQEMPNVSVSITRELREAAYFSPHPVHESVFPPRKRPAASFSGTRADQTFDAEVRLEAAAGRVEHITAPLRAASDTADLPSAPFFSFDRAVLQHGLDVLERVVAAQAWWRAEAPMVIRFGSRHVRQPLMPS